MATEEPLSTIRNRRDDPPLEDTANASIIQNGSAKPDQIVSQTPETSPSISKVDIVKIWAPTLLLIFGGCCSNVYTLESLIRSSPSSGTLLTAFQFLLTALLTLPSHFSTSRGWRNLYLKPRSIPITKWTIYTAFFLFINSLNNMAFNYSISVPLHIILRSAGPVTTMLVGRVVGKRTYPPSKVVAVILLFVGVVIAALSDSLAKQPNTTLKIDLTDLSSFAKLSPTTLLTQAPGFGLLFSALLLSAFMGLYADSLYSTYGRTPKIISESIFYSHAISLSFFASSFSSLRPEFVTLVSTSPTLTTTTLLTSTNATLPLSTLSPLLSPTSLLTIILNQIPTHLTTLLLNALTQYICISGVNSLSAKSSSLTVSIVLNIRKLVSLLLSIWLFGNRLNAGVMLGAGMVFAGGGLYAVPNGVGDGTLRSMKKKEKKPNGGGEATEGVQVKKHS